MALVVGIPACSKKIGIEMQHATPARYGAALMGAGGCLPVLLPPVGEAMLDVLDRLDGLLLSGSPSNVEPALYGADESLTPGKHDPHRDGTTLPLVRAALARGMPVLAICRGIQELNVALGGSLHQQVHAVQGRHDHRAHGDQPITPDIDADFLFRLKHRVRLSGAMAAMVGEPEIMVNSLHEQALDRLGQGLEAEAFAEDGTVEAVRVTGVPGWAHGVQWHPEWHFRTDAPSRAIFAAFGEACRAYNAGLRKAA